MVLVETVKVQDPKANVPVAVEFPLVSVNVVGEVKDNVSGVLGRPGKKADPSGMINCCPTRPCTALALVGTATLDTGRAVVSSSPPSPHPNIANALTTAHTATR